MEIQRRRRGGLLSGTFNLFGLPGRSTSQFYSLRRLSELERYLTAPFREVTSNMASCGQRGAACCSPRTAGLPAIHLMDNKGEHPLSLWAFSLHSSPDRKVDSPSAPNESVGVPPSCLLQASPGNVRGNSDAGGLAGEPFATHSVIDSPEVAPRIFRWPPDLRQPGPARGRCAALRTRRSMPATAFAGTDPDNYMVGEFPFRNLIPGLPPRHGSGNHLIITEMRERERVVRHLDENTSEARTSAPISSVRVRLRRTAFSGFGCSLGCCLGGRIISKIKPECGCQPDPQSASKVPTTQSDK